jgi:electron transport complex protein RnfC
MRDAPVTARNPNQTTPVTGSFSRLHQFHGGLVLPSNNAMSTSRPVAFAGVPDELVLPLQQHIGETATPLVGVGDVVLKGQVIAAAHGNVSCPVHAPSSGTVSAIEPRPFPHPSGLTAASIVIATDGRDTWAQPDTSLADYRQASPEALLECIRNAGIVGLGGAGFPTAVKLRNASRHGIDLLLINGIECEPYITCDNMLMQERSGEILQGVFILQHILRPKQCVIAIEDGMPEAEAAMRQAISAAAASDIEVVRIPEIYPSGGERQLIWILTGKEVPSQGFPSDIGIICQNVGTAAAVARAVIQGQPLVSRFVTVTGGAIRQPRNLEALIGTPFSHLVAACGGYTPQADRLLMGGPMMGFALHSDDVPVIKTTNCILAVTREEMAPPPPAMPCIRCGKCTEVCPAELLPQQLYWHARNGNLDAAQDYNLFDCIECGCCAYVCPSHIPLVQYYRHAKTEIWAQEKQKKAADIARRRHEARLERLERIKRERAERMARKKQAVAGKAAQRDAAKQEAIQAALERVRQKKAQAGVAPKNVDDLTPEQQQQIEEVNRRRQQDPPSGET